MFSSKSVRMTFAVLAVCGLTAACGSSHNGATPAPSNTNVVEAARASHTVSVASITDADGREVADTDLASIDANSGLGSALAQIRSVTAASVTTGADGVTSYDFSDANGSVFVISGETLVSSRGAFPMSAVATESNGADSVMHITLNEGDRTMIVSMNLIAVAGDSSAQGQGQGQSQGQSQSQSQAQKQAQAQAQKQAQAPAKQEQKQAPAQKQEQKQTQAPAQKQEQKQTQAPAQKQEQKQTQAPAQKQEQKQTQAPAQKQEQKQAQAPAKQEQKQAPAQKQEQKQGQSQSTGKKA